MTAPVLGSGTVIRALYDHHHRFDQSPTATQVAEYLDASEVAVLAVLRELRAQRLFRDRRTKAGRVWEPWGGWR